MTEPRFFPPPQPLDLQALVALTGARRARGPEDASITGVAPIGWAGPSDAASLSGSEDAEAVGCSLAGVVFASAEFEELAPEGAVALITPEPARALAQVAAALFPSALRPQPVFGEGVAPGAVIHPEAKLENDVTVDPGAVVGPRAEIGCGAVICANAVIGADVRLGRGSVVGPGATIVHALIGDRVIIRQGARIGQDGVALASGSGGHAQVPQTGRAIVQDDVQIGANATVDRGADRDTVIGEGAKIDNLVRIGHNVTVGRHCVVLARSQVPPGATLDDFEVVGNLKAAT